MRADEYDDHRVRSFRSIMKSVQPMLAQAVQLTRRASSALSSAAGRIDYIEAS